MFFLWLTVLIFANGLFSATEMAFLSLNQSKLRMLEEETNKNVGLLKQMLAKPNRYLTTICIVRTFLYFVTVAYGVLHWENFYVESPLYLGNIFPYLFFCFLVLFYCLMFFLGEMLPKKIILKNPEKLALSMSLPLIVCAFLFAPFAKLFSFCCHLFLRLLGMNPKENEDNVTEEEIRMLVDAGGETGVLDENEKNMINNIFEFDNKTVGDIASHRKDIVALSVFASYDEVVQTMLFERYSRVPIYKHNIDNIVGVLHLKDFLVHTMGNKEHTKSIDIAKIMREPYFVPLSKKADALFAEMQKRKVHMAIVVDEYGGTQGLISMEDLIEAIMGNIYDEYDEIEKPDIECIGENLFVVNGSTLLETVSSYFGVSLPQDDYDTLGGFVVSKLGRIPLQEEKPELMYHNLVFKVFEMDEMRVSSLIVYQIPNFKGENE